jgi:uncharacterized protein YkwD
LRKLTALGLMALTLTSMLPLTANAAVRCNIPSFSGRNVISINGYGNSDDLKAKLQQMGYNCDNINFNDINKYFNNCQNSGNGTTTPTTPTTPAPTTPTTPDPTTPTTPAPTTPTTPTTNKTFTQQVVDLVNAERAKEGLSPLTVDTSVEKAANVRAKEIQSNFDHTRPNGSSFSSALKEQGVNYRGAGENIAWGQRTPQEVMTAWMNSPGHRANIMNKSYTHIGVGNLQNGSGTQYWVQLFTY